MVLGCVGRLGLAQQRTQRLTREVVLSSNRVGTTRIIDALRLYGPCPVVIKTLAVKVLVGSSNHLDHGACHFSPSNRVGRYGHGIDGCGVVVGDKITAVAGDASGHGGWQAGDPADTRIAIIERPGQDLSSVGRKIRISSTGSRQILVISQV